MSTEPTRIVASMTGSRHLKNLTWSGRGGATAHGAGTSEVDNCNPDCAQGTFTGYPATVTVSGLTGYGHGEHAYSVMVIRAPSAPVPPAALSFSGPYLPSAMKGC